MGIESEPSQLEAKNPDYIMITRDYLGAARRQAAVEDILSSVFEQLWVL